MIYIIGDTHGENDARKLSTKTVKKTCDGSFPDYAIICGDFGFIWSNNPDDGNEIYWKKWLEEKPYQILFVDGNHENHNRLEQLPNIAMFGGVVGQFGKNIFHLRRGYVFNIDGKSFFVMGGATSIDRNSRRNQVNWWPQEVPSYREFYLGQENLDKVGRKVDYVLSHTGPITALTNMFDLNEKFKDPTDQMLEEYRKTIEFRHWYFGHFHADHTWDKFTCLWNTAAVLR